MSRPSSSARSTPTIWKPLPWIRAKTPLILALEQARAQKEEADRRIRLLFAYAREFQQVRRYPLRALAQASGYTVSGVTTAYGTPEIRLVQRQIHRSPASRKDAS